MRSALIGTGHIARQHLGCIRQLPGVELAAVCDLSPAAAEVTAARFGAAGWFTDHRAMLEAVGPDVVHVTTPAHTHMDLATAALAAGSHVIVEKPAASSHTEALRLVECAAECRRQVVESQNYLFNEPIRRLRELHHGGALGEALHAEVLLCLDILGPGSPFVDRNRPHPALSFPGGAISDFLPHLASLAYAFIGPHRSAHSTWWKADPSSPLPNDEFRALVQSDRGSAALSFSSHGRPETFSLRLTGTKLRATAGLFEARLTLERLRDVPKPLIPVLNGVAEGVGAFKAALGGLATKLSGGPGSYEGLWTLISETYAALSEGREVPVPPRQIAEVRRLLDDLVASVPVTVP